MSWEGADEGVLAGCAWGCELDDLGLTTFEHLGVKQDIVRFGDELHLESVRTKSDGIGSNLVGGSGLYDDQVVRQGIGIVLS